ncbi:MAG: transglutaminase-like domain-containing protein [Candidatus Zixiibacteriota bacterium]
MRTILTVVLLVILTVGRAAGRTDAPSFATSVLYKVEITEKKEKGIVRPALKVEKTVTRTVLRDLDLREGTFSLYESGHAPAKGLQMTLNGKKVSGDFRVTQLDIGKDVYLSDSKVHTFIYSELPRRGDVVEYHITYNYIDIAYCPLFYVENSPDDSMASFRIDVSSPAGWAVTPDIFDLSPSDARLVEHNDPSRLTIEFGARPRRPYRDLFAFNEFHAMVALEVRKGDSVYTLSNPNLMVAWYQNKTDLHPALDSSTATPFLDSISQLGDPRRQLKGIHDWVRGHIRYLMDHTRNHSILPRDPDTVLIPGFGDCKDRAYLICALAKRLQIPVHMGVVSTKPSPPFAQLTPWQFNHVICAYTDSLGTILFDPTAKYSEFDAPPDGIVEKPAVILDPDNPRFEIVSRVDSLPSLDFSLRAHIDSLEGAELTVVLRREYLARLRYLRAEQTLEGWDKNITDVLATYLPNSTLSKPTLVETQADKAVLTYRADISRYVAKSSKSWYLPGTMLSLFHGPDLSERVHDSLGIYFDDLTFARLQCHLVGAKLSSALAPIELSIPDIGEAFTRVQEDSSGVLCDFTVRLNHTMYEGDMRMRLNDFAGQYNSARKQLISFSRGAL